MEDCMSQEKIEKLLEQRKKLDARIQMEKNRLKEQKRKDDTRLKILVGAMTINEHAQNGTIDTLKEKLAAVVPKRDKRFVGLLDGKKLK